MGHALFLTIQDSLSRYYKNKGETSLWIPGLDHAGLATYEKIQKYMKENNQSYETAAEFIADNHRSIILEQIKEMGALPDWSLCTYSLDKEYQNFALKILKLLWEDSRISFKDGQYYLNIKDLALELKKDLEEGIIKITPEYEIKSLIPFLENFELWNISRQIPWGTKLPFIINNENIEYKINGSIDCLDTWFNSSLWPIGILIKNQLSLDDFYPAELIETGSDILFFWCARMLIMGNYIYKNQHRLNLNISQKYPFYKIYLHGIIRDKEGRKFSKSLGNGIDPLDMMAKYGADAMRLFIISRTGPSEDILFKEEDLQIYKKFINKIWQSGRFLSMYAAKAKIEKIKNPNFEYLSNKNKNILEGLQRQFSHHMEKYEFLQASRLIHSKFKEFFCDQWIEENKQEIQQMNATKIYEGILILDQMLAMMEIFCPYISFEIKSQFFEL